MAKRHGNNAKFQIDVHYMVCIQWENNNLCQRVSLNDCFTWSYPHAVMDQSEMIESHGLIPRSLGPHGWICIFFFYTSGF